MALGGCMTTGTLIETENEMLLRCLNNITRLNYYSNKTESNKDEWKQRRYIIIYKACAAKGFTKMYALKRKREEREGDDHEK